MAETLRMSPGPPCLLECDLLGDYGVSKCSLRNIISECSFCAHRDIQYQVQFIISTLSVTRLSTHTEADSAQEVSFPFHARVLNTHKE